MTFAKRIIFFMLINVGLMVGIGVFVAILESVFGI